MIMKKTEANHVELLYLSLYLIDFCVGFIDLCIADLMNYSIGWAALIKPLKSFGKHTKKGC